MILKYYNIALLNHSLQLLMKNNKEKNIIICISKGQVTLVTYFEMELFSSIACNDFASHIVGCATNVIWMYIACDGTIHMCCCGHFKCHPIIFIRMTI
jgi:hypothetical protein